MTIVNLGNSIQAIFLVRAALIALILDTASPPSHTLSDATMHLMYTLDAAGKRIYTLKKTTPAGEMTKSAHPGEYSDG